MSQTIQFCRGTQQRSPAGFQNRPAPVAWGNDRGI